MSPWLPKQFSHGPRRQNNYDGVRAIDHGGENMVRSSSGSAYILLLDDTDFW